MFKFFLATALLMTSFLFIAACSEETSTPPTPEEIEAAKKRKADVDSNDINNPNQSPNQTPICDHDDVDMIELIPKFHWMEFKLLKSSVGGSWQWNSSTETDPMTLFTWLGEDEDNLFIVASFTRKEHLQKVWPMFSDQIKMPYDLHPNLPSRNFNKIAIDDQWDLVESMPEWFMPIALRLAKQMGN